MINKLTIEQLERLKELAVANQEYNIASELCLELSERYKERQVIYEGELMKSIVDNSITKP